jgi:exonuclease VII small subunit
MFIKSISILLLTTGLLFSATQSQVEEYMALSGTDKFVESLTKQCQEMSTHMEKVDIDGMTQYDDELIGLRFREYIETHLSESEMQEVLGVYKNLLFLSFISNLAHPNSVLEKTETRTQESNASTHADMVPIFYEALHLELTEQVMLNELYVPLVSELYSRVYDGKEIPKSKLDRVRKKDFLEAKKEQVRILSFVLKNYTQEDLEQILQILKRPEVSLEQKVKIEAIGYALKEYLQAFFAASPKTLVKVFTKSHK